MKKYFGKTFVSLFALLLAFPTLAIGGSSPFPSFEVLKEGGVSLEPGDLRVGRIKLHPGFAFESKYDSNILNQADKTFVDGTVQDRTDDFVFTNMPSMGIALERAPGEVLGFNFNYLGKDENFLEEGGSQNFFNHKIDGAVNIGGPGGRGDVTLGGGWQKNAGGNVRDLNSNIGVRQATTRVNAFVDARYSPTKILKLQLLGSITDDKFRANKIQNVDEYDFGGSVFWQATAPAAFGVKYNHRIRRYETPSPTLNASGQSSFQNDNSIADQVFLAMKWVPTSLLSGEIAVGYETKRFENLKGDNLQGLVAQIEMHYSPVQRTDINFKLAREFVDSSFSTIQAYVLSTVGLGAEQRLGKKAFAFTDILYEHLDYQRSAPDSASAGIITRQDNQVQGVIGIGYEIQKWLVAKGSYEYEQNISNFDSVNYKKHVGIFEIAAKY